MDRRVLFGVLAIVFIVGIIALLLSLPPKPTGCVSNDGQCPIGCKFENDKDCPRTAITSIGEVRRCLSDLDCVIAKPICGNERCNFNDVSCQAQCSCEVAISKDYKSVFENANTVCEPAGQQCAACQPSGNSVACISGECRVLTR